MPKPMLEGKVAVVTGAGGGIGREIAVMMAAAGARVIINDVGASLAGEGQSATPAQETRALIRDQGGEAEISTDSVADWASAQKIVQAALDHFGRIDAVVNNAGILRDVIFHKMSADDWLAVIGVHLNGSFFVSRAAASHFREQLGGAFVHMTSTSGLIGNFGQANYSAAKLGLTALSKSIALDMRRALRVDNMRGVGEVIRIVSPIVAARREQPEDDLISVLVEAEMTDEDGETHRLSDAEIYSFTYLLLAAGSGTTWKQMGITLSALLARPDLLDAVRGDPDLLRAAIEESVRWAPTDPMFSRFAPRPRVRMGGCSRRSSASVVSSCRRASLNRRISWRPSSYSTRPSR